VYHASGRIAPRIITRQTDERGRPLSIFAARRQRGKVEHRDAGLRAYELEAAVRSWSASRSWVFQAVQLLAGHPGGETLPVELRVRLGITQASRPCHLAPLDGV